MTLLFDPPNVYTLPLSKGADLFCTFVYKPLVVDENNDPVLDVNGDRQYVEADYPSGATIALIIDADTDTPASVTVDGTIDASVATFHADKAVADLVPKAKYWRVVLTYGSGLDVVLVNGKTARYDGQAIT